MVPKAFARALGLHVRWLRFDVFMGLKCLWARFNGISIGYTILSACHACGVEHAAHQVGAQA